MTFDAASEAARSSALAVWEAERGVLAVAGTQRASWLNGVVTAEVTKVTPEAAAFGLLLSKVGKIQTDFYVIARGEELCLALAPGTEAVVQAELERMLVMEDAELERVTDTLACLSLHGPRAQEIAAKLATRDGITSATLDRAGLGGTVLLVPRAQAAELTADIAGAGAVVANAEQWERFRVERRLGLFGVDYGPNDNPHEAALDRAAISWTKGCYLGQEVVFMQDARGKLKRRLVLLDVEGTRPSVGAAVTDSAGEPLGEVTSSTESAVSGSALALARVKSPHYEPGVRLSVGGAPALVRAEPV